MSGLCIAGLLLAAGGSRRFARDGDGAHKLLADLHGEPVLRRAARSLLGAALGRTLVVAGARADGIAAALDGLDVEIARNSDWAEGMGGSIALGVRRLRDADAILVALADMPLLGTGNHAAVVAAHDAGDPCAVTRGAAGGRPGHPVLFGAGWFGRLAALRGDEGAGALLRGHDVRLVPLDPDTQRDVDTPEALAAVRERWVPSAP